MTIVGSLQYDMPPSEVDGRTPRVDLIRQLHLMTIEPEERHGQWVRLNTYTKGTVASAAATDLRTKRKLPDGRWEFRSGKLPQGETGFGLWARYLGPVE